MNQQKRSIIILIVILIIAFLIRFIPNFLNSINFGITFLSPDPYYHMRRIVLAVQHFPHLPTFDYYLSYPTGAYCQWPPLFDFLCAALAYVIGFGHPSLALIEFIGALYPIIFALLVIWFTYLIGKEVFNESIGLIAAAFLSILPPNLAASNFGYADHHIAEAFSILLISYLILKNKNDLKSFIWLGMATGMALLFWQGAIVFAGMAFVYFFINYTKFKFSPIAFLLPIIIILPFSLGNNYIGGYFTHRGLSLLYVSLLGLAGVILLLKTMLFNTKYRLAIIPVAMIIALFFFLFLKPQLITALTFVTKNEWTKTIQELKPLFWQSGYIETIAINKIYGRFYYVWPIVLILFVFDKRMKNRFFFMYFGILLGFFNFVVIKYGAWFSPFYVLLLGYFIFLLYTILRRYFTGRLKLVNYLLVFALLYVIFQPVFSNFNFRFGTMPTPEAYKSFIWLRDSTETTSYFSEPTKKPEYSVMCFWHTGHFIIYISQRPAVVTNFGADLPNFEDANRYLVSQTEDEANQILESYSARYIYCDYGSYYIYNAAKYLNQDVREYFDIYLTKMVESITGSAMTLKLKGVKTIYYRLYKFNGCSINYGDEYIEPIRHSRLVYNSPTNSIKIFEFVKAAKLKGKTQPFNGVKFRVLVNLPNLSFMWGDSLMADKNGNFLFTCPYNTDVLPAMVILNKDTFKINITNESVLNGDTLSVLFMNSKSKKRY